MSNGLGILRAADGPVAASSRLGRFDPVLGYVELANTLTAGQAGERFCITREQLEKAFLVRHSLQHSQMLSGARLTWRNESQARESRSRRSRGSECLTS